MWFRSCCFTLINKTCTFMSNEEQKNNNRPFRMLKYIHMYRIEGERGRALSSIVAAGCILCATFVKYYFNFDETYCIYFLDEINQINHHSYCFIWLWHSKIANFVQRNSIWNVRSLSPLNLEILSFRRIGFCLFS